MTNDPPAAHACTTSCCSPMARLGVYELKLQDDGRGIRWVGLRNGREVSEESEPEYGSWLRFKLWLWSLVVSAELL